MSARARSVKAARSAAVERFGGIDVVIANAGIASYGSILNVDRWIRPVAAVPVAERAQRSLAHRGVERVADAGTDVGSHLAGAPPP